MDLIFETPFRGEVTEIRMADAIYRAGVDDAGRVCVEAPMDVGLAQGWIRRVDLELKRKAYYEQLGESLAGEMRAAPTFNEEHDAKREESNRSATRRRGR